MKLPLTLGPVQKIDSNSYQIFFLWHVSYWFYSD